MLDFSRSSKYGIIDNNLLDFYRNNELESIIPPEENHGDGIVDTVVSGLKKIKEPIIKAAKEIAKGAVKEGAQQLGSFALRKIVDKVTTKKPDDNFIQEEDINAKARRKILKDLQIHPVENTSEKNLLQALQEATPQTKNLLKTFFDANSKNNIDEDLKKILNITTPLQKKPPSIRIGE